MFQNNLMDAELGGKNRARARKGWLRINIDEQDEMVSLSLSFYVSFFGLQKFLFTNLKIKLLGPLN